MKTLENSLSVLVLSVILILLTYKGYNLITIKPKAIKQEVKIVKEIDSDSFSKLSEEVFNLKDETIVLKRQIEELSGTIAELNDDGTSENEEDEELVSKSVKEDLLLDKNISTIKDEPVTNTVNKTAACFSERTTKWHLVCNKNGTPKNLMALNESFCREKATKWINECKN